MGLGRLLQIGGNLGERIEGRVHAHEREGTLEEVVGRMLASRRNRVVM